MLRLRPTLAASVLLVALTCAQSCYYPDGTQSKDVACNPQASNSACCPQSAFCLGSGLCIGNGLLLRGSCTDNSWKDPSCPQYCQNQDQSKASILLPCSSDSTSNTYACGINSSSVCSSGTGTVQLKPGSDFGVVLRPAQVSALVGSQISATAASLASVTVTVAPGNVGLYTGGQMAGLAAGLVLPFLAALAAVIILYIREKRKYSSASLMLKLPDDNKSDFNWSQKSRHNSAGTQLSHHSSQHPTSPGGGLRSPTHSTFHSSLRSPTLDHSHASVSAMERSASVASRTGTIHVSMSPRPTPRGLVPSWSTRSTADGQARDSMRSRNTASPNMTTFLEMKAKSRQQELEAARLAERHENMVHEYQRSMASQQAASSVASIGTPPLPGTPGEMPMQFPRPPLPVHELASPPGQGGVVVHEMGDGRKSVYQPPVEPK